MSLKLVKHLWGELSSVLLKNVAIGALSDVMLALNRFEQKVELPQADEIGCHVGIVEEG